MATGRIIRAPKPIKKNKIIQPIYMGLCQCQLKFAKKFNYVTQLKHANPLACRIGGYLHDSLFAKNIF